PGAPCGVVGGVHRRGGRHAGGARRADPGAHRTVRHEHRQGAAMSVRPDGFAGTPVTGAQWTRRYEDSVMNTFGTPSRVLTRGQGAAVWAVDCNPYLDLAGGIAVNSLGHAHPAIIDAVTRQLTTLGHVSNLFISEPQVRLAEALMGLLAVDGPKAAD